MSKIGENTIKVIKYLQDNYGKKMTSQEVAEALDLSTATVNGVFTAMGNKGLGVREEGTVTGAIDVSFISATEDGLTADLSDLSDSGKAIMEYLRQVNGQQVTTDDGVEATGIEKRKFVGAFNSLVKNKKYAQRTAVKVEGPVTVKYLVLTEAGRAWTPETADAE